MATGAVVLTPNWLQVIRSRGRDYLTLTKPEVNLLILMTTSAGYYLASTAGFHITGMLHTLVGTLLVASGTATLNQWAERGWDAQMRRTASRPLPSGRVTAWEACAFGVLLSVAGGIYLAFAVNSLTAWLAISTLVSYLLVYTPLKRRTPLCTALGALPGAAPVLIGWAGAAASLNWHAWFLFAILFLWQFPHFLAIALMYREDYSRAGYRMLPGFDRDSRFTRAEIMSLSVLLILFTLFPLADHGTPFYWAAMLLSGAFLLFHVGKLARSDSRALARKVVHATVVYLPIVLAIMVVWKA